MIKLIAIDLDGTLLNSDKKIPEENVKAIQKAAQAGVKLFFVQDVQSQEFFHFLKNWAWMMKNISS